MNKIRITENISPRGGTFWEVDIDMPGGNKEFHVFDNKKNAEDFTKGFRVGTHFALSAIQTLNPSNNISIL